jgi:probable addiction module antidote protein
MDDDRIDLSAPGGVPPDTPLDTLDAVAACLAAAFESGDAERMTAALAAVAGSDGLAHLAAAASLPRAQLAEALRAGEMSLDTLLAIMKVVDLHLPPSSGRM